MPLVAIVNNLMSAHRRLCAVSAWTMIHLYFIYYPIHKRPYNWLSRWLGKDSLTRVAYCIVYSLCWVLWNLDRIVRVCFTSGSSLLAVAAYCSRSTWIEFDSGLCTPTSSTSISDRGARSYCQEQRSRVDRSGDASHMSKIRQHRQHWTDVWRVSKRWYDYYY